MTAHVGVPVTATLGVTSVPENTTVSVTVTATVGVTVCL